MKNNVIIILFLFIFFGCATDWDSSLGKTYKMIFMGVCAQDESITEYCECVWERITIEYSYEEYMEMAMRDDPNEMAAFNDKVEKILAPMCFDKLD